MDRKKATKRKASPTEIKKIPSKSKNKSIKGVPQQPSQTIQERLNSNNGKFVDPDSFINLFTKIPFTAGEIVSLRRTCVWWNHVLSSNALWKGLFQRDFGPSEKCMESINKRCIDQKEDQCFWYSEYLSILHQIPKVVPLPRTLKAKRVESESESNSSDEDGWGNSDVSVVRSVNFSHLKLYKSDREQPSYQVHKLAIILSILSENNYYPKTHSKQTEMLKVGIAADTYANIPESVKLIPLLQFCYAILCGEEERIYNLEDYKRIQEENPIVEEQDAKKKKKFKTKKKETDFIDDYDEPIFAVAKEIGDNEKDATEEQFVSYYDEKNKRYDSHHVGISPNIEGPFKPFMFYLKARGLKIQKAKENFYRWRTDQSGWAPGFFNASFGWFYHLTMDSAYNYKDQSITITKSTARELVN